MHEPRSAGAMGEEFPYDLRTVCYIEVGNDGTVRWGPAAEAYPRAKAGESRLFAVWPGEWSSHLFEIDDLDQLAGALRIVHDPKRTGLADHQHRVRWQLSPYEANPNGSYITIDVWLDCGCTIRDIKAFAAQMREQRGWDVASSGFGSGGDHQFVRVRRKSLEP